MKKSLVWKCIMGVAGIVLILCLIFIKNYYMDRESATEAYSEVRQEAVQESDTEVPESVAEEVAEEPAVSIPIDFAGLQEENPDIYAWITIPGTAIDYPVLQSQSATDDSYYLNHTVEGVEAIAGSIYTEQISSKDFTDNHTVIYGHNMKDGTMFRALHEYEDEKFFDENRTVLIYTPTKILTYEIFAAYVYDNRHLLLSFDCQNEEIYGAYLEEIFSVRNMESHLDSTTEVTTEDQILTLSTCNRGNEDERYLVQAVLKNVEE